MATAICIPGTFLGRRRKNAEERVCFLGVSLCCTRAAASPSFLCASSLSPVATYGCVAGTRGERLLCVCVCVFPFFSVGTPSGFFESTIAPNGNLVRYFICIMLWTTSLVLRKVYFIFHQDRLCTLVSPLHRVYILRCFFFTRTTS